MTDFTEEMAAVHDTKLSYDEEFSVDLLKQKSEADIYTAYMLTSPVEPAEELSAAPVDVYPDGDYFCTRIG